MNHSMYRLKTVSKSDSPTVLNAASEAVVVAAVASCVR